MHKYPETMKLTHHQRQQSDFSLLMPILVEAKLKKAWLYHKGFGRWYTPKEFEKEFATRYLNNYDVEQLKENIVVRDPKSGHSAFQKAIRQRTEEYERDLVELTKKGELFLNKVIDYYRDEATGI